MLVPYLQFCLFRRNRQPPSFACTILLGFRGGWRCGAGCVCTGAGCVCAGAVVKEREVFLRGV